MDRGTRPDAGWPDEAIAEAARHGIKTVLGTPTATPPRFRVAVLEVKQ